MWRMAPAGTQGPHPPVQPRRCQEYEPGPGDKWARGSGEQRLDAPGGMGKGSDVCRLLPLRLSGEMKDVPLPQLSGDAHQGLSLTTQVLRLPMAPLPA